MTGPRACPDLRRAVPRAVAAGLAGCLILGGSSLAAGKEPLQLALLIDTSGSIRRGDQAARNKLAADIAQQLGDGGQIAVYTFDNQPRLIVPRTGDAAAVAAAVADLGAAGQFTALNDAIFDATRYLAEGPAGKRAILILSDGLDENSALVPEDGIGEARQERIPIFAVGIGNVQERYLRRIAKLSGGEYFAPGSPVEGLVGRVVEQTPFSQAAGAAARTAAVAAPAPVAAAAAAARPAPAAASTWPILAGVALAVTIALAALGFVLLRRPAAAPAPVRHAGGAAPETLSSAFDEPEQEDMTLVARLSDVQGEGQTLVLTLKPLLHVTRGPNFGKFFEVSVDSATSIGRAPGNEIVLDDRAVSSQHCRIRPQRGIYELIDMKSTNGTFVNERRVARTNLAAGDVIKIGESSLQFRMDHMKS